jgi:DNA mismatch repair protein PMS2
VKFYGYLTRTVLSGSVSKVSKECTFYYLNFRPIDLPKKIKALLQQLYQQYNPSGQVFIVINMLVADGCFDINVSPDKREVFLKDEA